MEDKGFERLASPILSECCQERNQAKQAQNQVVETERRTEIEQTGTLPKPTEATTGYTTEYITDPGLRALIDAWPNLPESVRREICELAAKNKAGKQ